MPNYERVFQLSDEEYLKARCVNTLEFPVIIQWVGSFKAFDLRGGNNFSRLHQLPKGTVLVGVNNQSVSCEDDLKRAVSIHI